jgi:extradiol dioxygenase family protein
LGILLKAREFLNGGSPEISSARGGVKLSLFWQVHALAEQLRNAGIAATEARLYPQYAPDYTATFFTDPDGIRLEVTCYRQERRERHDNWQQPG